MTHRRTLIAFAFVAIACLPTLAQEAFFSVTLYQSPEKPTALTAPSHRIPALAQCSDGSLLAVADYRLHLSDIGTRSGQTVSQIELRCRRSTDGGLTWTEQTTIGERETTDKTLWRYAMGDAAIVADRQSGDVLVLCAAGTTGMAASTAANPIRIAAFRSHDNGVTWDEGSDVTSLFYDLYGGEATAIFITSGSLRQSQTVKVGSHYRIYAAHPIRTKTKGNYASTIFSDDFGRSWHVLGGSEVLPEGSVYEEAKVDELPDGSVAMMVRDDSGASSVTKGKKNFNLFSYSDVATGAGSWSKAVSGITGMANACNNSLLVVPARRLADGQAVSLALVALPFHTVNKRDATNNYGRRSVGFYFKELASASDYDSGAALAAGWQRGLQVTDRLSAYTDLLLLADNTIALLMEDNGKQGRGLDGNNETEAYDIVFCRLSLEQITANAYQLSPSSDNTTVSSPTVTPSTAAAYTLGGRPYYFTTHHPTPIIISQGRKAFVR